MNRSDYILSISSDVLPLTLIRVTSKIERIKEYIKEYIKK